MTPLIANISNGVWSRQVSAHCDELSPGATSARSSSIARDRPLLGHRQFLIITVTFTRGGSFKAPVDHPSNLEPLINAIPVNFAFISPKDTTLHHQFLYQ